jgi:hypothetical protein
VSFIEAIINHGMAMMAMPWSRMDGWMMMMMMMMMMMTPHGNGGNQTD